MRRFSMVEMTTSIASSGLQSKKDSSSQRDGEQSKQRIVRLFAFWGACQFGFVNHRIG